MTLPARLDQDDAPPPPAEDPPSILAWMIAGGALVLAYIAALALMRPAG